MSVKTYDTASYGLAEHFLQDEPCRTDPELYKKHCHSLALEIQQAVEDWFITPDEPDCPPGHEICLSCRRVFKFGDVCTQGGCPCGGDV